MRPAPPERIDLGEVLLRRFTAEDATALSAVATGCLDHLAPWMPWATSDGVTPEAMATFIAETTQRATDGDEAVYGLFAPPGGTIVGSCGLHGRVGPGAVEIGYWLAPKATGRGLMTRVVGVLSDLVLGLDDVSLVEVRCDEANGRSQAVPRRLGFTLERTMDAEIKAASETGRQQIWVRTAPATAG